MKLYDNFINDGTLTNFYGGKTDSGYKLQINQNNMTKEKFAEEHGFVKLTQSNHPKDGQTVEILGSSISKDINVEKVEWFFDGFNHRCKWITHEFNKGMMTTSLDYWRPIQLKQY